MAKRRRLTPADPDRFARETSPEIKSNALPIAQIAAESAEAAAFRDVAETLTAARDEGRMIVTIALDEIEPAHMARDRTALGSEDFAALKASIGEHGQRTAIEVMAVEGREKAYGLISGWRRYQALRDLHAETGETRFASARALIRQPGSAAEAYVAMVEENEIRADLSHYERAQVVAEAVARGVFPDKATALKALFANVSRAKRSKIGSFIEIHDALGGVLKFPHAIPERLGLRVVDALRAERGAEICERLMVTAPATAEQEIAALEAALKPAKPTQKADNVSRAKHAEHFALGDGMMAETDFRKGRITLTLSGKGVDVVLLDDLKAALLKLRS